MSKRVSLESFIQERKQLFINMKEDFAAKYCDQARLFSEKMGPDLSYLAVNSVKTIVHQIW